MTTVTGDTYRITVLTPHLVRLEQSLDGRFEDRPTQVVLHRDLGEVQTEVTRTTQGVEVVADGFHLSYDEGPFSPEGLSLQVRGGVSSYHSVWRFAEPFETLGGTARTLDKADGEIALEPGVLSRNGFAVLDDSRSLVQGEDGLEPRPAGAIDLYVFAHGRDYRAALRDYYALTGPTPLVPRYALGNWWSRYHRYSDDEYRRLVERFASERLPFSVAVLDMDWHITDPDPRFGSGWTGYTFDRELFPDPAGFLDWLHDRGMRVTLNDHPADGVRAFEEAYPRMARSLGVDPATEAPLSFDVTDARYLAAFFEHVAHPLERLGVDFWWIDWQSGPYSRLPGLDPLWALNDRHFHELASTGVRPMIFSRYAGPGSHRYPVGFSGDAVISWASLAFQPYFTATASNIGYGWWSHDIGGHMWGVKDDELAVRWVQLGVMSPITRLHSAANPFSGKEPWRYGPLAERVMGEWLRFRHRLVPYLYTMAERASVQGRPLVEPLYHELPWREEAYEARNTYLYGSELLVAPITEPGDARCGLGRVQTWLPPGDWWDVTTGWRYAGDRRLVAYRDLSTIPVLARAGAILPLAADGGDDFSVDEADDLEIRCYAGADGSFTLYEDDGAPEATLRAARTPIRLGWEARTVVVGPTEGASDVVPASRTWRRAVVGVPAGTSLAITVDGDPVHCDTVLDEGRHTVVAVVTGVTPAQRVEGRILGADRLADNDIHAAAYAVLDAAQVEFEAKSAALQVITSGAASAHVVSQLMALSLDESLLGRLVELVTASEPVS